jgi:hypothetical protein
VGRGLTNKEIAKELGISEQGVKVHISRLLERYGAANRVELVGRTRAWSDAEERSFSALSSDLAGIRVGLAHDGLGLSRQEIRRDGDKSRPTNGDGIESTVDIALSLATVRELLNEVDVAVKLARELPADAATGSLGDAIRSRVRAAMAESDRLLSLIALQREAGTADGPARRSAS